MEIHKKETAPPSGTQARTTGQRAFMVQFAVASRAASEKYPEYTVDVILDTNYID